MLRSKFLCNSLPISAFLDLLEWRRKRWQFCSSRLFWPSNLPFHCLVAGASLSFDPVVGDRSRVPYFSCFQSGDNR